MTDRALAIRDEIKILALPASVELLEDNRSFTNRISFLSESQRRKMEGGDNYKPYIIAQSTSGRWWGCGCPSYINARKDSDLGKTCKHLIDLGLVGNFVPVEVGTLSVGARNAPIGEKSLRNADKKKATAAARAHLKSLPTGSALSPVPAPAANNALVITDKRTYGIRDEIKALGGTAHYEDGKFSGWKLPTKAKVAKVLALLDPPAAVAPAAAAPLALPAVTPTNVNMVDGKIVVEFDAKDAQAVFALLAQISK